MWDWLANPQVWAMAAMLSRPVISFSFTHSTRARTTACMGVMPVAALNTRAK